ncbi:MAG: methyl-accepting chemotaxis protein [Rectinemataceae bacterium]|jgi:methyl-accepting chemotaxis protein
MAAGLRGSARLFGSFGITVKLAILAFVMAASCAVIFAVLSRGFSRLMGSIDAVQLVQVDFLRRGNDLQSQCFAIQVFVLNRALDVSLGARGAGSASRSALDSLSMAAKTTALSIERAESLPVSAQALSRVLKSFEDYLTVLGGMPKAFDAGKRATAEFVDAIQEAFRDLSNQTAIFLGALRETGDAASESAHAQSRSISLVLSAVIIGAVILYVAIAFLIIRSITKPLGGLVAAVGKIGDGDLTVTTGISTGDELGKIAASVDGLVVDLRSLIGAVKERLALLENTGQSLSSMMSQTGAAVVQINSNIASTGGQLKEQSSAVAEVSAAIEELTRSVDALGAMIANQSSVISQSAAAVEEMIANVESVAANAAAAVEASKALVAEGGEGKARIDEVGESVAAIVRYSRNLEEAAALITAIAGRTNLLAMNAAIEAAHAGDAGRGFAVVADEIRKLAEQADSQSKDISADLRRVTDAIDAVRVASAAAVGSFASILDKSSVLGDEVRTMGSSMAEQREGGRLVLEGLTRLRDITREIEHGSGEMAQGNASMLDQVQKLTSVNAAVVRNNQEMTSGTREINEAVAGTISLSSENADLIAELRVAMDKFTLG